MWSNTGKPFDKELYKSFNPVSTVFIDENGNTIVPKIDENLFVKEPIHRITNYFANDDKNQKENISIVNNNIIIEPNDTSSVRCDAVVTLGNGLDDDFVLVDNTKVCPSKEASDISQNSLLKKRIDRPGEISSDILDNNETENQIVALEQPSVDVVVEPKESKDDNSKPVQKKVNKKRKSTPRKRSNKKK